MDVTATQWQNGWPPYILADDYLCTQTGPITEIHIWGSWYHDRVPFGTDTETVGRVLDVAADVHLTIRIENRGPDREGRVRRVGFLAHRGSSFDEAIDGFWAQIRHKATIPLN